MHILSFLIGTVIPSAVAQDFSKFCSFVDPDCGTVNSGSLLITIADNFGTYIIEPLVGGAAVLVIIYGAIRLAASGGDEAGKDAAKRIIKTGLIGLALAAIVWPIIDFTSSFIKDLA